MYERAGYEPIENFNANPFASFWGEKRCEDPRGGAADRGARRAAGLLRQALGLAVASADDAAGHAPGGSDAPDLRRRRRPRRPALRLQRARRTASTTRPTGSSSAPSSSPAPRASGSSDFSAWNADALYFLDPAGNVVELIARHSLPNASDAPFGPDAFLEVSEVGMPVATCPPRSPIWRTRWACRSGTVTARLHAWGRSRLAIVVPAGRPWFRPTLPAEPPAVGDDRGQRDAARARSVAVAGRRRDTYTARPAPRVDFQDACTEK